MTTDIEKLAEFLTEAARYFERRPTGGEDQAFWANVMNVENCRSASSALFRLEKELHTVLERESSTQLRHDKKLDELEARALAAERLRDLAVRLLRKCDRVFHFDLRHMIEWGDHYNQAVKDAADAARAFLSTLPPAPPAPEDAGGDQTSIKDLVHGFTSALAGGEKHEDRVLSGGNNAEPATGDHND